MTRVSFAEFFAECKDRLTDVQLRQLEPDAEYLRLSGGYLGLKTRIENGQREALVSVAVGSSMRWLWELRDIVHGLDIRRVYFTCRAGGPCERILKYFQGKSEPKGFYADGQASLWCSVESDCRRLRHG